MKIQADIDLSTCSAETLRELREFASKRLLEIHTEQEQSKQQDYYTFCESLGFHTVASESNSFRNCQFAGLILGQQITVDGWVDEDSGELSIWWSFDKDLSDKLNLVQNLLWPTDDEDPDFTDATYMDLEQAQARFVDDVLTSLKKYEKYVYEKQRELLAIKEQITTTRMNMTNFRMNDQKFIKSY